MPLTVALTSMTHLETKGIPADVSRELKQEVTEGRALSDAMARQPRIFSDLYVNMVSAGESSGSLVPVLRRMATHFQQFAEVQAKFKSAMIYPVMVICVGILLVVFFMLVMMPQVHRYFQRLQHRAAAADAVADRRRATDFHVVLVADAADGDCGWSFCSSASSPAPRARGSWTSGG